MSNTLKIKVQEYALPFDVSITQSNWSGTGPYTYTVAAEGITTDSRLVHELDETAENLTSRIIVTPSTDTLTFSTDTKPSDTINIQITAIPVR